MAGVAMPLASETVAAFRTAQEISSKEPAQLRRTVEDLESRITSQDVLVEQQLQYIQELEQELREAEEALQQLKKAQQKAESSTLKDDERLNLLSRIEKLSKANNAMEDTISEFSRGFASLFSIQLDSLDDSLAVLKKLPETAETKSLHTRINKQGQAIERAKATGNVSPINALRQLQDLEMEVLKFIISRPLLTFTRSEKYRADVLVEVLFRDHKTKCIRTPEASKILTEREEKPIDAKQAIRAMQKAIELYPDRVKLEHGRNRLFKLIKIEGAGKK